ncbi:response regulator [Glaciimonas immobilis]|uniref:Excisionase family DNA binding protein n=1 Tax=Glaciimonas immobilis TaxID=728004 RepID=A0A840RKT9_9BURK|nr:response regulator [Glaciimonas immobilis]MBB5198393.1 excisionase family DNA binding protein [Glaciimonas immobilis]
MPSSNICTTQNVAQMLGISVTSVQQLVEAGVIEAWKTGGGHRRIPLAAVEAYKASLATSSRVGALGMFPDKKTSILVVEDNAMQRAIYEKQISSWNLSAELRFCENGYQALVEIATHRPGVLLADIVMEGIDGYEVINTILGYPHLAAVNIAILSSLSPAELKARGGIPDGVVFFSKPMNYDELRGYLRACCAQNTPRVAPN